MKFRRKYRITIEDESHLQEIARWRLNVAAACAVGIAGLCVAVVLAGLLICLTPIRTLLPGYLKDSQRYATEEGLLRLDSLMSVYEVSNKYIENFLRVADTDRQPGDSAAIAETDRRLHADSLMEASTSERQFISEMEEREKFNISVLAPLAAENMLFFPVSAEGVFTKESETSKEGVVILPREENVRSAADGSVIAMYYSAPERGYVIVIQHQHGFVTSYTHTGAPLAAVGDYVNAGQIIALSPTPDSKGVRKFTVRMWHNALPIVPFDYIGHPGNVNKEQEKTYESPRGRL